MNTFSGFRVVLSPSLTEPGEPVQVPRTWRERLFTWPWRPWRTTRTYVPQVPSSQAYRVGDTLYLHPETWAALRRRFPA